MLEGIGDIFDGVTREDLENKIRSFNKYTEPRTESWIDETESLPMMKTVYERLRNVKRDIPRIEEYISEYMASIKDSVWKKNQWLLNLKGKTLEDFAEQIRRRCQRAYPSFLREDHVYILLRDRLEEEYNLTVLADKEYDKSGWDFLLKDNNSGLIIIGINTFVNTESSLKFAKVKRDARKQISLKDPYYIDMLINPHRAEGRIQNYSLYSDSDVNQVETRLSALSGKTTPYKPFEFIREEYRRIS